MKTYFLVVGYNSDKFEFRKENCFKRKDQEGNNRILCKLLISWIENRTPNVTYLCKIMHVPLHVNTYTLITVETIVIFPHL